MGDLNKEIDLKMVFDILSARPLKKEPSRIEKISGWLQRGANDMGYLVGYWLLLVPCSVLAVSLNFVFGFFSGVGDVWNQVWSE